MYTQYFEMPEERTCPCCGAPFAPSTFVVDLTSNTGALGTQRWALSPQLAVFGHILATKSPEPVSDLEMVFAMYGVNPPDLDFSRLFATYASCLRRLTGVVIERTHHGQENRGYRLTSKGSPT